MSYLNIFKLSQSNAKIYENIIKFLNEILYYKGPFGLNDNQRKKVSEIIKTRRIVKSMKEEDLVWLESNLPDSIKNKALNFKEMIQQARGLISGQSQSSGLSKGREAVKMVEKPVEEVYPEKAPISTEVATETVNKAEVAKPSKVLKKFQTFKIENKQITIRPSYTTSEANPVIDIIRKIFSKNTITLKDGSLFTISGDISQENYNKFISEVEQLGWDVSEMKQLSDQFSVQAEINKSKKYARATLEFRVALDETNGCFDFFIKVPDTGRLNPDHIIHIYETVTSCFVGETTNKLLPRNESIDPNTKETVMGYKIRRCPAETVTDMHVMSAGMYLRGLPSDYARFINMAKTRLAFSNSSLNKFNDAVHEYGVDGNFYDGRRKQKIDAKDIRFEGDLDGFENEEEFVNTAKEIAKRQLEGVLRRKGKTPSTHPNDFAAIGLYDAQVEGIKFLYTKTNAILGDETGYGKTVQMLTAAQLRILSEQKKGKNVGGLILTKNAVTQEIINGLIDILGNSSQVWDGERLSNYLKQNQLDTPERASSAPVPPPWKWLVMNYEKFSIPPINPDRGIARIEANFSDIKNTSMIAREIISKSINSLLKDKVDESQKRLKVISMEELYNYISSNQGVSFGEIGINQQARSAALSLVRRFFSNTNRREKLIEELMSKKFTSNINVMSREQAEKEADRIMENAKYDINAFMELDYNSASRILQQLIKETDIELSNQRAISDAKIKKIERRKNADSRQKELKEIINDPNVSAYDKDIAQEEFDELELIRFRFKEGGKRAIYTKYLEHLAKSGFLNLTVLDEVHTVKNGDPNKRDESDRLEHEENFTTFNIQEVTNNVPNVWGASATVVANRPIDLYNQLQVVNNPLGDVRYDEFERVASAGIPGMPGSAGTARAIRDSLIQQGVYLQRSKSQIWDKQKADEIQNIFNERFKITINQTQANSILNVIRDLKEANVDENVVKENIDQILKKNTPEDVIKFLMSFDPYNVKQVILDKEAEDNIIYEGHDSLASFFNEDFKKRLEQTIAQHPGIKGRNLRLVMFTHYRFAAAKAKVPNTLNLIRPHIERGERIGVFTASNEALDLLSSGIKKMLDNSPLRGKSVLEVRGGQDMEERAQEVNKFKESLAKSPYGAVVINIKAGGTGISLENTAYWSVFNDLPISVSEDEQALGRFYRINTDDDVEVNYMLAQSIPAEEKFYASLQRKKELARIISKLEDEDRQLISQGLSAGDEQRRKLLMKLADKIKQLQKLEEETKALQAQVVDSLTNGIQGTPTNAPKGKRTNVTKGKINKKRASNFANWYKFANSIVFIYE